MKLKKYEIEVACYCRKQGGGGWKMNVRMINTYSHIVRRYRSTRHEWFYRDGVPWFPIDSQKDRYTTVKVLPLLNIEKWKKMLRDTFDSPVWPHVPHLPPEYEVHSCNIKVKQDSYGGHTEVKQGSYKAYTGVIKEQRVSWFGANPPSLSSLYLSHTLPDLKFTFKCFSLFAVCRVNLLII